MVKVEIRNLRKAFSSDSRTTAPIDGLSLEMPAGGITAVIGRSGCGKTTLLRLLAGLEKPDSGEIRMEDAQGRAAAPRTAVVFSGAQARSWMSVKKRGWPWGHPRAPPTSDARRSTPCLRSRASRMPPSRCWPRSRAA